MTLPNALTIFRLAAAPAVPLALLAPGGAALALALFLAAAATDWLDGALARAMRQTSALGAALDPVADKAMVTAALGAVLARDGLDPLLMIPAAAIFLREALVSGLREALAGRTRLSVTRLAKWKTAVQMAALALLLAAGIWPALGAPGLAALWAAAALTVATGADYVGKALPWLAEGGS